MSAVLLCFPSTSGTAQGDLNRYVPVEPSLHPSRPFEILDSQLHAPGDLLEIPDPSSRLHSEGRLAIIIAKKSERIRAADAPGYIFGITAGCHVTSMTFHRPSLSWLPRSIYLSLGPAIVKGLDYENITIHTHLNGQLRNSERYADLPFDPLTALSYLSQYITLLPGDVILTGTPRKTEVLQPGTVVEVEIHGVGILRNPVIFRNSQP